MKQGNKLGKGRQVPVRPDGRPSGQNHGSLGSSDAPATGGGGGAEGERRLRRAGHCGTRCGPRGVGRKPRWVRPWRRGKSGRRSGLKRRSQARSPAATMAERPEDLNLPNAVITRIIKEALPDGVNISKEARSAISRAASVFVLYATSCANNFAMKGKRKTLNASDVLSAMEEMEFQRFVTPLKEALEAYRREQKGKKEASEQKKKDRDKKTDSEEQDKSRDEDNDEDEERLEEEEQNEEEEVDN